MEAIEIKSRWTGAVLYSGEHVDVKEAVEAAVKADADLRGADLRGADLSGADLSGEDLIGADLIGADLRGADLRGANLIGANLRGANLSGANLSDANLSDATVGTGEGQSRLVGVRPVIQVGPIGSRNDWLMVFWCGNAAGLRISTGCQSQITERRFLERMARRHGEGDAANVHAQHYIEALAFAKRLLKDQAEGKL